MKGRVMSVPVMSVSLLSTAVMLAAASASVAVVAAGRDAARMEVAAASGVTSTAAVIPANLATPVTLRVPDRANATPWIAASGDFVAVAWGASAVLIVSFVVLSTAWRNQRFDRDN